jgi:hypothetical protein
MQLCSENGRERLWFLFKSGWIRIDETKLLVNLGL